MKKLTQIKKIGILFLFLTIPTVAQYKRLNRVEKRNFIQNFKDLKTAYEEKNYYGFKIQGKFFLNNYQNILIDPTSKDIRPKFFIIDSLYNQIDKDIELQKLKNTVLRIKNSPTRPTINELEPINNYMFFLKKNGLDSLLKAEQSFYNRVIRVIYKDNDQSVEIYRKLSKQPFISKSFKSNKKKEIENELNDEFLILTTELDVKKLEKFEKENPGIFTKEIAGLKEKCRLNDRLRILREYPSLERIKEYKKQYPKQDDYFDKKLIKKYKKLIDQTLDVEVFGDFRELFPAEAETLSVVLEKELVSRTLKGSVEDGIKYLSYFPNGKHAPELEAYLRILINNDENNNEN